MIVKRNVEKINKFTKITLIIRILLFITLNIKCLRGCFEGKYWF